MADVLDRRWMCGGSRRWYSDLRKKTIDLSLSAQRGAIYERVNFSDRQRGLSVAEKRLVVLLHVIPHVPETNEVALIA